MPAPAGEIWLASADGSCATAGSCAHGPCGPGTIVDCPDAWENIAAHTVQYIAGQGSILVSGRTLSPGQSIQFVRPSFSPPPQQYDYAVDYWRGTGLAVPGMTAPAGWCVWVTINVPFSGVATSGYNTASYEGGWCSNVGIPGAHNWSGLLNWTPYGELVNSLDGNSWGPDTFRLGSDMTSQVSKILPYPGYPFAADVPAGTPFTDGGTGVLLANAPSVLPVPEGILGWGVESLYGVIVAGQEYSQHPVAAFPGIANFPWGSGVIIDTLSCIALPSASLSFEATLTLRNACEEPAP